ncbi:RecBCD enzyme subunit RecB [Synechococcus sp. MIT S9509]|nr:RecBCD enzyme subunit RecB [Synechococcus sp. MIT S9509]
MKMATAGGTRRFEANTYPLTPGVRLLEASAGTGKTFALAHLVLRLVTEKALSLDQLLVVTFTEAAADELRDRIGCRLDSALQGLLKKERNSTLLPETDAVLQNWLEQHGQDSKQRRILASRLLEALEALERADITTIHGFCRRSLRRQALQNGQAIDLNLDDDPQTLAIQVAHDLWREEVLKLEPGHVAGLMRAGLSPEALASALQKLDGDCAVRIAEDAEAIAAEQSLCEVFQSWLQSRWELFLDLWHTDGSALEQALRGCAAEWRGVGCSDTKPFSARPRKDRSRELDTWTDHISKTSGHPIHYIEVRNQVLLGGYFHPGTFQKTARSCGEADPNLAYPALQAAVADLWDGPAEQTWRHLLIKGLKQLHARRQQRGVVGFSGLLDALDPAQSETAEAWLTPLRARYRVVLIDEFQDTDPLQWRLLKTAFTTPNHLLLMVGDPKQAIYRFRGGDLNTYKAARRDADCIDELLDNRRTTPLLMKAMNQLMAPGLRLSELSVPEVVPRSYAQPLPLPKGSSSLQIVDINPDDDDGGSSRTSLEERIPRIATNLILLTLGHDPELDPSELCILVSRHRQAEDIRAELAAAGLPSRLVSQGDVFTSQGASDLQTFLDALARPAHTGGLRQLAVSSLLQWRSEDLAAADDNGQLDQLASQLQQLAFELPKLGLMGCLARLMDGQTVADLSSRGRLLGDLQQCARLVQDTMHRLGLDASSGADWLRRQRFHPPDTIQEQRQPFSDLAECAIAVVTVHRSKGLQYPVVICPYLWEAPSPGKGPLWRVPQGDNSGSWRVALNAQWGLGHAASHCDLLESRAEAERLAYVAITRAERHLVLFQARAARQEGNPLAPWLEELADPPGPLISLHRTEINPDRERWHPRVVERNLQCGAVPGHSFDRSWGRSSYSAWISSHGSAKATSPDPRNLEEGRDMDARTGADSERLLFDDQGEPIDPDDSPLGSFPRGAAAGDCLHRILEQIPFDQEIEQENNRALVERELTRSGLETDLVDAVFEGLETLVQAPFGGPLGDLQLRSLHSGRRLHELSFDLPVAHQGRAVQPKQLARAFRIEPKRRFGERYADSLEDLEFLSRGFLTGSIDLVFTDGNDPATARWWVADWKSNWIGERDVNGRPLHCGPRHYSQCAMEEQMYQHHYPLQAHLYLVALHRFLQWRLDGYQPERHLGGYAYVFLRGVSRSGGSGVILEAAPLQRLHALDSVLRGEA